MNTRKRDQKNAQKRKYQMSECNDSKFHCAQFDDGLFYQETLCTNSNRPLVCKNEDAPGENDPLHFLSVEMIDKINDLEDVKNVFKLILDEIQTLKGSNITFPSSSTHTNSGRSQDRGITLKGSNVKLPSSSTHTKSGRSQDRGVPKIYKKSDFKVFINKINGDGNYRKHLVEYWKKIENNSRQSDENAKIYSILTELFDRNFLVTSVHWGEPFMKELFNNEHLYLKLEDDFIDIIFDVYELTRSKESIKRLGKIFKNVLGNKVKREEKVGK